MTGRAEEGLITVVTERAVLDPEDAGPSAAQRALLAQELTDPFRRISRLARRILGVQVAIVSVVDPRRQTFKGHDGLPRRLAEEGGWSARDSLCRYVVASGEPLVVSDGREDPLVRESASITRNGIVAYAGVPLQVASGEVVGTLCVLHPEARTWTEDDLEVLDELAALAVTEMDYRLRLKEVEALESLALRLPEPVDRLGQAVSTTASLVEDPTDPRLPRMADVARTRLRPVETLTEDVQKAAVSHRQRRPEVTVTVDLRAHVRRAARLVEPSSRPEDLVAVLPDAPVPVTWTLPELDKALSVLIVTALQHLVGGAVRVEVAAHAPGGGRVRVVSPGRPMPASDLLRVVGAFSPSDGEQPVDVRSVRGTTRVRNQWASARSDRSGTTFEVTLPGPGPVKDPGLEEPR